MGAPKFDTWMPFYWGDYLADTMHFSTKQHGMYLMLIGHYWINGGPIKNDRREILRIVGLTGKGPQKELNEALKKFYVKGDMLHHKRIDKEIAEAKKRIANFSKRAGNAARARWQKHKTDDATSNASSMPQATPEPCLEHTQPQSHNIKGYIKSKDPNSHPRGIINADTRTGARKVFVPEADPEPLTPEQLEKIQAKIAKLCHRGGANDGSDDSPDRVSAIVKPRGAKEL